MSSNGHRPAGPTLYRSESRLRGILDGADAAFVSVDAEGLILDWNTAAEALFGWTRREAVGRTVIETIGFGDSGNGAGSALEALLRGEGGELTLLSREGREIPARVTISRLPAGGGFMHHLFVRDLSPQRAAEQGRSEAQERLAHQALHDALTGLPNRVLLVEHLDHALALARRAGSTLAVLIFDVDNLNVVNDSLGHPAGDQMLVAVAERLQDALRASDTISRVGVDTVSHLGGDEFAVVCESVSTAEDAIAAAERAGAAIAPPIDVAGESVFITMSVGIALSCDDASAESLLRDAGAAVHEAKAAGGGHHQVFDFAVHGQSRDRLTRENELRRAIEHGELRLHYQPIVSVTDGGMVGVEALVRWEHPQRGLLSPAEFLPLAEQSGLIVPLGHWVFEEAFTQAVAWHSVPGFALPLRVTVNVSGHQLARPETVDEIIALLEETGLAPSRLSLEITETVLLDQLETPVESLRRLQALGIRILLDDFGTGFSSLTYLRRLPLDAIKLDRSFVSHLDETTADRQIVAAVVQLARALEMAAIAEGVETEEQLRCLRDLGCHFAQGYYFARPMPAEQLTARLADSTALEAGS